MLIFEPVGLVQESCNILRLHEQPESPAKLENTTLILKEKTCKAVIWVISCDNGVVEVKPNISQDINSLSGFIKEILTQLSNFYEIVSGYFEGNTNSPLQKIHFCYNKISKSLEICEDGVRENTLYPPNLSSAITKGLVLPYCGNDKRDAKMVSEIIPGMIFTGVNSVKSWYLLLENETMRNNTELATKWARFMQFEMECGVPLYQAAYHSLMEISRRGINGVQYHSMFYLLIKHWKYGRLLKEWHDNYINGNLPKLIH